MYKIHTLNPIAKCGTDLFSADYEITDNLTVNNNSKDMNKDYNINNFNLKKQISNDKREEKNGSILPLNEQMPNNDLNGFENLKQKNFEAQSSI